MKREVSQWMTSSPVSIGPGESARDALLMMVERAIRHLPVVDERRRVIGVLTLDDLRAALPFPVSLRAYPSPEEREEAEDYTVAELMTYAPVTVTPETPLERAARELSVRRVGCLPVVSAEGELVAIFTEIDALRALVWLLAHERGAAEPGWASEEDALVRALRAERWRLLERLEQATSVERELSRAQHDEPMDASERGSDLQTVELFESLADSAARRYEALTHALDRAARHELFRCERCGGAIPVARLRALPGATTCVGCATKAESEARGPEVARPGAPAPRRAAGLLPGNLVYTGDGEGRLLRLAPFGTCGECGEVEGRYDEETDDVRCTRPGCELPLADVVELAVVREGDETVSVAPETLRPVGDQPYD